MLHINCSTNIRQLNHLNKAIIVTTTILSLAVIIAALFVMVKSGQSINHISYNNLNITSLLTGSLCIAVIATSISTIVYLLLKKKKPTNPLPETIPLPRNTTTTGPDNSITDPKHAITEPKSDTDIVKESQSDTDSITDEQKRSEPSEFKKLLDELSKKSKDKQYRYLKAYHKLCNTTKHSRPIANSKSARQLSFKLLKDIVTTQTNLNVKNLSKNQIIELGLLILSLPNFILTHKQGTFKIYASQHEGSPCVDLSFTPKDTEWSICKLLHCNTDLVLQLLQSLNKTLPIYGCFKVTQQESIITFSSPLSQTLNISLLISEYIILKGKLLLKKKTKTINDKDLKKFNLDKFLILKACIKKLVILISLISEKDNAVIVTKITELTSQITSQNIDLLIQELLSYLKQQPKDAANLLDFLLKIFFQHESILSKSKSSTEPSQDFNIIYLIDLFMDDIEKLTNKDLQITQNEDSTTQTVDVKIWFTKILNKIQNKSKKESKDPTSDLIYETYINIITYFLKQIDFKVDMDKSFDLTDLDQTKINCLKFLFNLFEILSDYLGSTVFTNTSDAEQTLLYVLNNLPKSSSNFALKIIKLFNPHICTTTSITFTATQEEGVANS